MLNYKCNKKTNMGVINVKKSIIVCGLTLGMLIASGGNAFANQDPNQQLEEYLKSQGAVEVNSEHGTEYQLSDVNIKEINSLKAPQVKTTDAISTQSTTGNYRIKHGSSTKNGLQVNNTVYGYAKTGFTTVEWNGVSGNSLSNWTGSKVPKSNKQNHSLTFNGVSATVSSTGSVTAGAAKNVLKWTGSSAATKTKYDLWSGVKAKSNIALTSTQYASTGNVVIGTTDYRHTTYASISF